MEYNGGSVLLLVSEFKSSSLKHWSFNSLLCLAASFLHVHRNLRFKSRWCCFQKLTKSVKLKVRFATTSHDLATFAAHPSIHFWASGEMLWTWSNVRQCLWFNGFDFRRMSSGLCWVVSELKSVGTQNCPHSLEYPSIWRIAVDYRVRFWTIVEKWMKLNKMVFFKYYVQIIFTLFSSISTVGRETLREDRCSLNL